LTYLGTLAGSVTWAQSINNLEQIVGFSALGYNYYHAFLYEDGMMVDLNNHRPDNPEWDLNYAAAINDVGQIVGIGTLGGQTRAFLLTPVPTPPTAIDDAYTTPFQVALTVPAPGVLANDYGAGMSAMQATLVTSASHGTLALNADGSFTYSPAHGYAGPDSFAYRATNAIGASNLVTVSLTVIQPANVQPPTEFHVYSIVGNVVTLRWVPPFDGPRPTSYSVEGGFPTGSADPIFTFPAPAGSFTVRVHSVAGSDKSTGSNEVQLYVRAAAPPSPPASLTAVVDGSAVHLAWRNTFQGGATTAVYLEVGTGGTTTYLPLGLTETLSAAGVAAGVYELQLWAVNAAGVGGPSNSVTITVPGPCSGPPGPPSNMLAYAVGRTIYVAWDPPTTGAAATSYALIVTGAYVDSFATTGRSMSGTVTPGTYNLSVIARNPCGDSPATPVQSVTVM
jgi:probable HAF family extracellular repeat protein/VCBS repeat-containing protein